MESKGELCSEPVHCFVQKWSACVQRVRTGGQIGLLPSEFAELVVRRPHFFQEIGVIACEFAVEPSQLLGVVRRVRVHSAHQPNNLLCDPAARIAGLAGRKFEAARPPTLVEDRDRRHMVDSRRFIHAAAVDAPRLCAQPCEHSAPIP